MEPLLTPPEVAGLLQVTISALAQMRSDGQGPAYIYVGRRVRYRPEDVQAYIEQNTHQPRPSAPETKETA